MRWLIRFVALGVVATAALFIVVAAYISRVPLPPVRVPVQTAFVFDRNGVQLASIDNGENREIITLDRIPVRVLNAVLAAEDRRFFEHSGVDPVGVARALYQDVRSRGRRQGGSTITQQYVKNVYVGTEASLRRKLREAAIAVKLERQLSKEQILERYLNTIYFGRGVYGIQAASKAYFGKDVGELQLAEGAYLAALIRGPESTDAVKHPERARQRRASVLAGMREAGTITAVEEQAALATPLVGPGGVLPRRVRSAESTSVIDGEAGTQFVVEYARRLVKERFGDQAFETRGLRITTTIDLSLQKRAQFQTFSRVLNKKGDPDAAAVVLNHDGQILAMVGGRDWNTSRVNLAIGRGGGGGGRPAGSTFKPFALAAAIREGFTVESAFPAPAEIEIPGPDESSEPWKVANYDEKEHPTMNLVDATRLSINTVYAQVVAHEAIGPEAVTATARLLGISSPLQDVDSVVLGTQNVSPLEMASAYSTFANDGVRVDPQLILSVTDANGTPLMIPAPNRQRVLSPTDAEVITSVLTKVVTDGTGTAAAVKGVPVAGKTGTTNGYTDAWFVGYTPKDCCVVAVWVGYGDSARSMDNVHGIRVSGGTFPAQIFNRIVRNTVKAKDAGDFPEVERYEGELLGESRRDADGKSDADAGSSTKRRRRDATSTRKRRTAPRSSDEPAPSQDPVTVNTSLVVVQGGDAPVANPLPSPAASPSPDPAPAPSPDPAPAPDPPPAPAPDPPPAPAPDPAPSPSPEVIG